MTSAVALTVASRGFIVVASLAATVLTARALGPRGRGDYFLLVTVATTTVQFGALGLHASNAYLAAQDRRLVPRLAANSLWVALVLGGGLGSASALIFTHYDLLGRLPGRYWWAAAALVPPSLFFLLGMNLLAGMGEFVKFNAIESISRLAVLAALAATALVARTVDVFLLASVVSWTVAAAALAWVLLRSSPTPGFDRGVFARGFRFAVKTYIVAVVGFLVLRGNVFILARISEPREVGYLSIATQVAEILAILPVSLGLVLFPRLVRDAGRSWKVTVRASAVVALALGIACLVIGVFASPLVEIAFGRDFAPAAAALRWALPGVVAVGVTTIFSQYLAAHGLPIRLVAIWCVTLGVLVLLSELLIPAHAAVGAAAALSGTYVVLLVLVVAAAATFHGATLRAAPECAK